MGLREYKAKRDFSVTAEPAGGKSLPKAVKGACSYVIQKHDASRLHYDFRLEMEGVLKSWAVPRGLPWEKGAKHLAVEVEDHPVEYATFEGVIPEGQYGGGTVMLWDRGTYHVFGEDPLKSFREGKLHFVLRGEKAKGEWTLVRTRMEAAKPQWLLLKSGESLKPLSKKLDDQSVATGRTMKQIAEQRDAEWQSNREEKKRPASKRKVARRAQTFSLPAELPPAKPRFIPPMKPRLVEEPPTSGDWVYELKFDGIRLIAVKNGEKVNLISRNGNELAARFPEVADAIRWLAVEDCVIDGEVVAVDEEGRSSFQLLQGRELPGGKDHPVFFYVFDLLQAAGRSLLHVPLETRKQFLEQLCAGAGEPIRYSGLIGGNPRELLAEVQRRGLEGLIGKQRNSIYEPDRRSGLWIKLKVLNEQEFVIGGYTPPAGARKHFGAVLVGYFAEGPAPAGPRKRRSASLHFAGKVGTGFDTKLLASLHKRFKAEARQDCPFADLPSKQGGAWVLGITPAMMRKISWVNPVFVCQVKFAEWTRDGKLR
ncbi:MAG TPA: non-homologous end-joining DNA ligase, partial [Chthoniobacterales bacterium]|nr:non-homologous end-joining DNA ligase [Chthoniobacterales bacterium]